jgi:hypothetical protein
MLGHAVSQMVSYQFRNTEAQLYSHGHPCGIVIHKVALGEVVVHNLCFPLSDIIALVLLTLCHRELV